MNPEPLDNLDRAIDETLASFAAAEPRRVSGASVREAMGKSRPVARPLWLAVAAGLILALIVNQREITPVENQPAVAASDPVVVVPELQPSHAHPSGEPRIGAQVALDAGSVPRGRTVRRIPSSRRDGSPSDGTPYEGLPRLTISPIDLSPVATTVRLETDLIETAVIEITPLVVPGLSPQSEIP